jgi:putative protease
MNPRPELLAPVGSLKHLRYALAYGADAVYAGMPRYGLRVRNNDFNLANLETGIAQTHAANARFFLTANIFPRNAKLHTLIDDLTPAVELNPDALIVADPGVIAMLRQRWPDLELHLSVQANTVNWAAVRFWQDVGIKRVILSRELSIEEIAEIREHCPDIELEVFVHGALCIAYSGRCLLSGFFNHRDANQGVCTNACRWEYNVQEGVENELGDLVPDPAQPVQVVRSEEADVPQSQRILIEDISRPGEIMEVEEDEHGSYVLNSKDLRAIEHVQKLMEIGVDSFKIEGRTKSIYYVARVVQAYRKAIDDAVGGRGFDPQLLAELENLASRGYTDGFFQRHHDAEYQNYMRAHSEGDQQQYVAEVLEYDERRRAAHLLSKNQFSVGDRVEWIRPEGNETVTLDTLELEDGSRTQRIAGGGHHVWVPVAADPGPEALLARFLS